MIVTVTPNPSIDRTLEVGTLQRGRLNRADNWHVHAGGKGVNVARALLANGHPAAAVVAVGGEEGRYLMSLLAGSGIELFAVELGEPTRENLTLAEADGTVTKVNAPGPTVAATEVEQLVTASIEAVRRWTQQAPAWLVGCGSLPPGAPEDLYARLVRSAASSPVAIDTSGAPLAAAADAGPDLLKPNVHELAELRGRRPRTLGDVIEACRELRAGGVGAVLASLGRDGALLVDADGACWAGTPPVVVRSSVGAGDAALAGFLAGGARGVAALTLAVAWGAAAVALPGTRMPRPDDLDLSAVDVEKDPDPDRPLGGNHP